MTGNTSPQNVVAGWTERDLSAEAADLPRAFEMDGLLEHAAGILGGGRHLLLVGEPGVGKSALVAEIARRAPSLETLACIADAPVLQLSVGVRMSRLGKKESLHEAFAALMDALPRLDRPVVAYFRDGDLLYQTGLAARLDSFCLRQRLPVIVEGRPGAMNDMLELFEELEQHFVALGVDEPDPPRALRILEGWAADGAARGGRAFEHAALEEAVHLTHRFLARTRLPRKAIDLLRASATTSAVPPGDAASDAARPGPVQAGAVIARFCSVHSTPRWLVDPAEALDLEALEERFRDALLGQGDAVAAAMSTVALIKAGLSDLRRPFGVFLFVGPTGVGKTHLAKMLAAELFGAPERMVRLNMGDFAGPRGADALFGDPEHHLPANRRGVLAQRLMGRAFGVVLLDEFEKAHPAVHDRLLPLIDEGSFVNGAGETVSCRSSIIIATSNAGAEVYRESALGFTTPSDLDSKRDELDRRIAGVFRFELLNRFDRVVHFQPLSRDDIRELAARELAALESRPGLGRRGTRLGVDDAVLDWLAARGYDARYGARFLKRTIEREVTTAVADALARAPAAAGETLHLGLRRGRVTATRERAATAAREHGATAAREQAATATRRASAMRAGAGTDGLGAAALVERAAPRLASLEHEVAERDRLLAEMAEPTFWDDEERRARVTERFRVLDVSTRVAQRFARPIALLREAMDGGRPIVPALLDDAAAALREWELRERSEGVRRVWLLLSAADDAPPPRDWLLRLARTYLAWCRRSELRCTPAAFEPRAGDLFSRLALDIEGPGAEHFLDAERGVHRLRRGAAAEARIRVDVVPQESDGFGVDVRDRALLRGPFAMMAEVESALTLPHTGQRIVLAAASRAALAGLVGDLQAAWSGLRMDSPEVVRSYGEPGGLALDPRTGVSRPLRTVERGQLRPFLDAWERDAATPASAPARDDLGDGRPA